MAKGKRKPKKTNGTLWNTPASAPLDFTLPLAPIHLTAKQTARLERQIARLTEPYKTRVSEATLNSILD